jgi:hypothetical protein
LLDVLVDAIDLAGDLELVIALGVCAGVENLVNILGTGEAGDGDLGDILRRQVSK